jgi:integrase
MDVLQEVLVKTGLADMLPKLPTLRRHLNQIKNLDKGEPTPTLRQLTELHIRRQSLSPHTAKAYRSKIKRFVEFQGLDRPIDEITEDHLIAFKEHILRTCTATTFNTLRRHIQVIFVLAVKESHIYVSPLAEISQARVPTVAPKAVPQDLLALVTTYVKQSRDGFADPPWYWLTVIAVFYFTGMRRRQLAGLRWADLDFTEGIIHLSATYSKNLREWRIPMPGHVQSLLLDLRVETLKRVQVINPSDPVFKLSLFATRVTGIWSIERSVEQLSRFFRKLMKRTGVEISPHRLRHTAGTEYMRLTRDPKSVQMLLGHSKLDTTMRYNHPTLDDVRSLMERLKHGPI